MQNVSYHRHYTSNQCEQYEGDEGIVTRKSGFWVCGVNVWSCEVGAHFCSLRPLHRTTPRLHAPQLTPRWDIQWSDAAVIPNERPCFPATGGHMSTAVESQTEETDTTKGTKKRLKCFKEPEQEVDDRTKEASCNVQNTPQLKEFRLTLFFHTLSVWVNIPLCCFDFTSYEKLAAPKP